MKVKKGAGGVKAKPKPKKNAKKKATSSKKLQNRKATSAVASTVASNGAVQVVPPPKLTVSSTPPTIPPTKPVTLTEARQIIRSNPKVHEIFRDIYLNGYGRNVVAWPVTRDDPVIYDIRRYIRNGQCCDRHRIKIKSILRVISKAHLQESFDGPPPLLDSETGASKSNRMMLWHGSIKQNIGSILQKGFRLPNLNEQMFGAGIYFSDRAFKSCRYSMWDDSPLGYLLLCDVELGNIYRADEPMSDLKEPPSPEEFDSVQGIGRWIPDRNKNKTVDGTIWPLGKTVLNISDDDILSFNEYVVYKKNRVTPKYLVKVEISF